MNRRHCTKIKFSMKDFFNKCDQIRRKLRICSHLKKKYSMENFIFCAVQNAYMRRLNGYLPRHHFNALSTFNLGCVSTGHSFVYQNPSCVKTWKSGVFPVFRLNTEIYQANLHIDMILIQLWRSLLYILPSVMVKKKHENKASDRKHIKIWKKQQKTNWQDLARHNTSKWKPT